MGEPETPGEAWKPVDAPTAFAFNRAYADAQARIQHLQSRLSWAHITLAIAVLAAVVIGFLAYGKGVADGYAESCRDAAEVSLGLVHC